VGPIQFSTCIRFCLRRFQRFVVTKWSWKANLDKVVLNRFVVCFKAQSRFLEIKKQYWQCREFSVDRKKPVVVVLKKSAIVW